jgi:hypothetical protein
VRSDIFRIAESAPPFWPSEWFSPIISYTGHFSILQFPDAHIPINAPVSVIAVPFDHDDVPTGVPARHAQPEIPEMRFHLGNPCFATKDLATLRPSSDSVVRQRRTQQAFHTRVMTWLFHLRNRSPILPHLQHAAIWRILRARRNQQCNRLLKVYSRSHRAVIRVYDETGAVIEAHKQFGEFKEW